MTIYFDNAATTRIKPEVLKSMVPYLTEEYGNPSSIYQLGRHAKRDIENARNQVARLINAKSNEIYFTSGGTESDNTAIKGMAYLNGKNTNKNHIITTKIEHHAVLKSCAFLSESGFNVTYLNVDKNGFINLQELENSITDKTFLISVMFANNEIGTIEPIKEAAKIAHKYGIVFHTDAVQAVGNVHIDVKELGVDMLSLSGHKIYGPKGIGALYVKEGISFKSFIDGGHQEKNKRAGTENLAGIVGLGKACELAKKGFSENHIEKVQGLRDYYVQEVLKNIDNVQINGPLEVKERLPGNSNISFKGVEAIGLLLELDKKCICVSTGSSCNSSETSPSHVLTSIGISPECFNSAIRVTFGDFNTKWEVDYLVKNLKEIVQNLRKINM